MASIFASAAHVIIWLNEASEYSKQGMEVLGFLASGRGFEEHPPWERMPPELVQRGLQKILQRSWFHRIWTVQEAALSARRTTMMCGAATVSWPTDAHHLSLFIRGLKYAAISTQWAESGLARTEALGLPGVNLDGIVDLLTQQHQQIQRRGKFPVVEEPDLLDLAYSFRDRLSSDPRDKIYAILGLALIRGIDTQLASDYTKPYNAVFDEFRLLLRKSAERDARRAMTERHHPDVTNFYAPLAGALLSDGAN